MNFIDSRQRRLGLTLPASILLLTAIFLICPAARESYAQVRNFQAGQANKLSAKSRQMKRFANRNDFSRAAFQQENSPTRYAVEFGNFSEIFSPSDISAIGNLDPAYGVGGKVTTQVGNSQSEALAAAVQTDGRLVAAGYGFSTSNADFALARYNSDGSLDASFGANGKVVTDIAGGDDFVLALAIQPADGKLIAAGSSASGGGGGGDFAIARYNSDGTLDATFGAGGIVTTDFGGNSADYIDGIALQADGKIVAAGYRFSGSFFHFALARYNSDGSLDASFGTGGKVVTALTAFDDLARAVVIQADGKIVAAGEANADFALVRYNADGTLDASFGVGGKAVTSINVFDAAYDVVVQPDGRLVAAGEAGDGNNADFALVRYTAGGALDATFGAGGIVTTAFAAGDEIAYALKLDANNRIIAGGYSFSSGNEDFAIARYNGNGTLDASFGAGGKVTTDFSGGSFDYINALVIQSGNRVIGVGSSGSNFAAAAYIAGNYSISGSVTYGITTDGQLAKFVPGVVLNAAGNPATSTVTSSAGNYQLTGLENGAYTVTASKMGDVNSITSFDASLVARSVAGFVNLTANQQIAADATNNGTLSSLDAARIAQTAANISNSGIAGQWKFVPASRFYSALTANLTGENYQAILVGEVSGNWTPPAASGFVLNEAAQTGSQEEHSYRFIKTVPGLRADNSFPTTKNQTIDAAQATINVSLPANSAASNGTVVTIPVIVGETGGAGVAAFDFVVRFDPNVLQPAATPVISAGTLSQGFTFTPNPSMPGSLFVSGFGTGELSGAGTLLKLQFNVVGASGATTPITFQSFQFNEGEPAANSAGGVFTVIQTVRRKKILLSPVG